MQNDYVIIREQSFLSSTPYRNERFVDTYGAYFFHKQGTFLINDKSGNPIFSNAKQRIFCSR